MSVRCLRGDLPASYAFSVTAAPHRAKLDQNESAFDVPAALKRELLAELEAQSWNRYIQPADYVAAKRGLGEAIGVDPDRLAITAGADQALEAAFLVGGGPGRTARWFEPTYPYIAHAARRTFTAADPIELGAAIDDALGLEHVAGDVFAVASPNNPTGGQVDDAIIDAAADAPERLVIVDEAYYDFSRHTVADRGHDNVLVVRSLSKSSIAGVHLGYVVAHPDIVRAIERMYTAPYQLNALSLIICRRYGELAPHVREAADGVIAERERVAAALAAMPGVTPRPSRANFILFEIAAGTDAASAIHQRLADEGVRIRNVAGLVGLADFLRVTIGTRGENDLFLAALGHAL